MICSATTGRAWLRGFGEAFRLWRHLRRLAAASGVPASVRIRFGTPGDNAKEAAFGTEKTITAERVEACDECGGMGAASTEGMQTRPVCRGAGQVRQVQNTLLGQISTVTTCYRCGQGQIITVPSCLPGQGRIQRTRDLKVRLPPGVETGTTLRLGGQGEAGMRGGPAGDLYVVLMVHEHAVFKRDGLDILCEVPISFTQAALGAEIQVPTLYGPEKLYVPEGTQTGATFRIRDRGCRRSTVAAWAMRIRVASARLPS